MSLPSATLLAQSALSGVFIGALYGLLGLGLSLSWGLLHVINLAHFGFAFLAAYVCYQLASVGHVDPLLTLAIIVPAFFALGVLVQWLLARFAVSPLNSLLATFGITAIIEAIIQGIWTADFRKLESAYASEKFRVGGLFLPVPELVTFVLALALCLGVWAALRYTDWGKALRALAEDAPMAAAFGVNRARLSLVLSGVCTALAGVAGVCLALGFTLTPAQIYAWVGVVFAAVMLGGLGSALGPLIAGIVIGVSEAMTAAVVSPSWSPIVSFTLLILLLLLRPGKA
jgi:branched-chain amino acid transport system permease protein